MHMLSFGATLHLVVFRTWFARRWRAPCARVYVVALYSHMCAPMLRFWREGVPDDASMDTLRQHAIKVGLFTAQPGLIESRTKAMREQLNSLKDLCAANDEHVDEDIERQVNEQIVRSSSTTLEGRMLENMGLQGLGRKRLLGSFRTHFNNATVGIEGARAAVHASVWALLSEK